MPASNLRDRSRDPRQDRDMVGERYAERARNRRDVAGLVLPLGSPALPWRPHTTMPPPRQPDYG